MHIHTYTIMHRHTYVHMYMQFHTRMCTHTTHTAHTHAHTIVYMYVYVPAMYIRMYVHEHTTHSSLNEFCFLSVTFLCCVSPNCSPCCCVPPLHAESAQYEPEEAGETHRNDIPTNSHFYTRQQLLATAYWSLYVRKLLP